MAVILHIEASTEICSVALSEDGQVFFERVNEEERSHAKVLAPYVEEAINATEGLQLEYFQIVDGDSLQEVAKWEDSNYLVGCIALFCGKIRLIDNIKYKEVK